MILSIKRLWYPSVFFLRTVFLDVRVNQTPFAILPFASLFMATGDADIRSILFLMLFFSVTHLFVLDFKTRHPQQANANAFDLSLYFHLLPTPPRHLKTALLLSALTYCVVVHVVLFSLLLTLNTFPVVDSLRFDYDSVSHVTRIRGVYTGPRGLQHVFVKDAYPSIVFGIVKARTGRPVFPGYTMLLPICFITATFVLLLRHRLPVRKPGGYRIVWPWGQSMPAPLSSRFFFSPTCSCRRRHAEVCAQSSTLPPKCGLYLRLC